MVCCEGPPPKVAITELTCLIGSPIATGDNGKEFYIFTGNFYPLAFIKDLSNKVGSKYFLCESEEYKCHGVKGALYDVMKTKLEIEKH